MAKCIFCGKEEEKGRGLFLVKNDGKIIYFCSSKCRKSYEMGKKAKKLKWAKRKEK